MNAFHIAKIGDLVSTGYGLLRVVGEQRLPNGNRIELQASNDEGTIALAFDDHATTPTMAEMDAEISRLRFRIRDLSEWQNDIRRAVNGGSL